MKRALLPFAVALVCACNMTPPVQQHSSANAYGTAYADTAEKAAVMASLLEEIGPRVQRLLPDCTAAPVEIHLVPELDSASWGGVTMHFGAQHWIELPDREIDARFRATLAHELVHYWLGPSWRALPGKIEEGLANYLGAQVEPEYWPAEAGFAFLQLSTLVQGGYTLEWSRQSGTAAQETGVRTAKPRLTAPYDAETLPDVPGLLSGESPIHDAGSALSNRPVFDAVAFLVVARAGVAEVNALCRRATLERRSEVPARWLLEAARLDGSDLTSWKPAVDALLSPEARDWILERVTQQSIGLRAVPPAAAPERE